MRERAQEDKLAKPREKPDDKGQGSFEESFSGKGPSKSKQGPKKVPVEKNRA